MNWSPNNAELVANGWFWVHTKQNKANFPKIDFGHHQQVIQRCIVGWWHAYFSPKYCNEIKNLTSPACIDAIACKSSKKKKPHKSKIINKAIHSPEDNLFMIDWCIILQEQLCYWAFFVLFDWYGKLHQRRWPLSYTERFDGDNHGGFFHA